MSHEVVLTPEEIVQLAGPDKVLLDSAGLEGLLYLPRRRFSSELRRSVLEFDGEVFRSKQPRKSREE